MATLWSCPKSDCPPTEIAPVDVPESGEAAGAESERRFTTDEVAALLDVPLDTIHEWHKKGTGPPGYQLHKESHYRMSDVVRWVGGARGDAGGLPERVRWDLHAKRVQDDARPVTRPPTYPACGQIPIVRERFEFRFWKIEYSRRPGREVPTYWMRQFDPGGAIARVSRWVWAAMKRPGGRS